MASEIGTIHYAAYRKSDRLQRLLALVLDGKPRTTMEIINGAGVCAVNSAACELRENGFNFLCTRKAAPSIYQLFDIEEAKALSEQLLAPRDVVNG